jgi:adenylate cyclase
MKQRKHSHHFSTVLFFAFSMLTVPILALVICVAYIKNSHSARELLQDDIADAELVTYHAITRLFANAIATAEGLAQVAASYPNFFSKPESQSVLHSSLLIVDHLGDIYLTLEDGSVRAATRITTSLRTQQPDIPADAQWQTYFTEPLVNGEPQLRHQTYFAKWPIPLSTITRPNPFDARRHSAYMEAKARRGLFISDPIPNALGGSTEITIAAPILRDSAFLGAVAANFPVFEISKFLANNRVSPNSVTAIIDHTGHLIAPPLITEEATDPTLQKKLDAAVRQAENVVRDARGEPATLRDMSLTFMATIDDVPSSISVATLPNSLGLHWRAVTIVPEDDYIGPLRSTNALLLWLLAVIIPLEWLAIRLLSRKLSAGIASASSELNKIRAMDFSPSSLMRKTYPVREVAELHQGVDLLESALRSFAQYIPLGVVRQLVESGRPLALGVEKRQLSVLFTDVENFSTLAEKIAPDELLLLLSQFFSAATEAIATEGGTVDKFIGDAVMAFWGAPNDVGDHELRACRAALRLSHRVRAINAQRAQEGKETFRIRIGLNSAEVLVGNVGSTERLSYTAIGDGVNVASRLEGVNKQFGTTICISDNVYERVADKIVARPLGEVSVKGRQGAFMVYELLGVLDPADAALAAMPITENT